MWKLQHIELRIVHNRRGSHGDARRPHLLQDVLSRPLPVAAGAVEIDAPPFGRGPAAPGGGIAVKADEQVQVRDAVGDLTPSGQAYCPAASTGHGHGDAPVCEQLLQPLPQVQGECMLIIGPIRTLVGQIARVMPRIQADALFSFAQMRFPPSVQAQGAQGSPSSLVGGRPSCSPAGVFSERGAYHGAKSSETGRGPHACRSD